MRSTEEIIQKYWHVEESLKHEEKCSILYNDLKGQYRALRWVLGADEIDVDI